MSSIVTIKTEPIAYSDPFEFYRDHTNNGDTPSFLLESRTRNLAYARQSIVVPGAALRITGKNDFFCFEALTESGAVILREFGEHDFGYAYDLAISDSRISGRVSRPDTRNMETAELIRQPNSSYVIRTILDKFSGIHDEHLGLYGAFAYDFARNFIDFGDRYADAEGSDFELFMPTTVVFFDDVKETANIKRIYIDGMNDDLQNHRSSLSFTPLERRIYEDMTIDQYREKTAQLIDEIRHGRMMQCVLSRNQGLSLQMPPIDSYERLREANPSPYSFFFSLGQGEYLYGASPEIHIKVVGDKIEIRPIAGTVKRSDNALDDAIARMGLQTDPKELREHSMLVDLATSELCRLSKPGTVKITDLYTVEAYPNLYHLVSGVSGILRPGIDSLDSLLTTIPAGTLSGAPKAEAMTAIEQLENSRRGFYGGAVGYLGFDGGCNTGITIRSVYVKDGRSFMRAGAGVVAHSIPEGEAREIELKSEKAIGVLEQ